MTSYGVLVSLDALKLVSEIFKPVQWLEELKYVLFHYKLKQIVNV